MASVVAVAADAGGVAAPAGGDGPAVKKLPSPPAIMLSEGTHVGNGTTGNGNGHLPSGTNGVAGHSHLRENGNENGGPAPTNGHAATSPPEATDSGISSGGGNSSGSPSTSSQPASSPPKAGSTSPPNRTGPELLAVVGNGAGLKALSPPPHCEADGVAPAGRTVASLSPPAARTRPRAHDPAAEPRDAASPAPTASSPSPTPAAAPTTAAAATSRFSFLSEQLQRLWTEVCGDGQDVKLDPAEQELLHGIPPQAKPNGPYLRLLSPGGSAHPDFYSWPLNEKANGFDPARELYATIRLLSQEPALEAMFTKEFEAYVRTVDLAEFRDDYEAMTELCSRYNRCIKKYKQSHPAGLPKWKGSTALLQHMMSMVYNRSITDPTKLNRYKGWSAEVYGEFSSAMISEIVKKVPIKPTDRFIDLGSGVGQVVLQVAAEAGCVESFGVEKQENPSTYARVMQFNYEERAAWFGISHGEYNVHQGDFLDEAWREKIDTADIIFVNNFAFGTKLNQQLKERFANCKEGARIVSSLNFSPLTFTITERNLTDIGTILSVKKINGPKEGVSWTSAEFDYFVHTVDRSMLEFYFQQQQQGIRKPFATSQAQASSSESEGEDDEESGEEEDEEEEDEEEEPQKKGKSAAARPSAARAKRAPQEQRQSTALKRSRVERPAREPRRGRVVRRIATKDDFIGQTNTRVTRLMGSLKQHGKKIRSDLQKKATRYEVDYTKLHDDVKCLSRENKALRASNREELETRAAVSGSVVAQAVHAAAEHEQWFRAYAKAKQASKREQDGAEAAAKLHSDLEACRPSTDCLARVMDFLHVGSAWNWADAFAPSLPGVRRIQTILKQPVRDVPAPKSAALQRPMSAAALRANKRRKTAGSGKASPGAAEAAPVQLSEAELLAKWQAAYFPKKRARVAATSPASTPTVATSGAAPVAQQHPKRGAAKPQQPQQPPPYKARSATASQQQTPRSGYQHSPAGDYDSHRGYTARSRAATDAAQAAPTPAYSSPSRPPRYQAHRPSPHSPSPQPPASQQRGSYAGTVPGHHDRGQASAYPSASGFRAERTTPPVHGRAAHPSPQTPYYGGGGVGNGTGGYEHGEHTTPGFVPPPPPPQHRPTGPGRGAPPPPPSHPHPQHRAPYAQSPQQQGWARPAGRQDDPRLRVPPPPPPPSRSY